MVNNKFIIFYNSLEDLAYSKATLNLKINQYIFIEIKGYRKQKSNLIRFFENEFLSIPILRKVYKIISFANNFFKNSANNKEQETKQKLQNLENIEYKTLFNYITPELFEKCDTSSREIYEKLKEIPLFKDSFNLFKINLFEANRFEFVHNYYYVLLNLLVIKKIFLEFSPDKLYITPNVDYINKLLVSTLARQFSIPFIIMERSKFNLREKFNKFLRLRSNLIEHIWYWQVWKVLKGKQKNIRKNLENKSQIFTLMHYRNFYPSINQVFRKLEKNDNYRSNLFTPHKLLGFIGKEIAQNELSNVFITPFVDYDYSFFRKNYISLKRLFQQILNLEDLESLEYDSILLSNFLKIIFFDLFEKYALLIRYFVSLKNTLEELQPNLIIVLSGNDPYDVLATRLAKLYNIPTLFIPHALTFKRRDFAKLEQDYIVCAGKRDRDNYVSLGTSPDKIRILGIPLYDKAYDEITKIKNGEDKKESIIAKFDLNPNKRIILLLTTFHEDHIRIKIFKSVVNAVQNFKNHQLVVKLHPIETDEFYKQIISQEGFKNVTLIRERVLHELISASDLVIGSLSGAQIEALLLGKNVINLVYDRLSDPYLMDKYNAAITVFDSNKLESAIDNALNDQKTQKILEDGRGHYIQYCLYKFDGNSSLRVYDLINEILGK